MRGSANFRLHPQIRVPIYGSIFINQSLLSLAILPCLIVLALGSALGLSAQSTNKPHIPPWSVSRPPVPSQSPQVTPGGTFSRPQSTFSPQTGTFSRPSSTFAHPASSYTPLPPIQLPADRPNHPGRFHRPRPVNLYPQTVIVHNPVVYEPYYVPVETPAPAQPGPAAEAVAEAPLVLDLPPGATIRKPTSVTTTPSPVAKEQPPVTTPKPTTAAPAPTTTP
jgi:hypothetical protein